MKKSIMILIALATFAGTAFAADTIEFPAANGKVTFHHKIHQELLKGCTKCHKSNEGGKIDGFGKEWAHKECKGCHAEMKKGPVKCAECHKK